MVVEVGAGLVVDVVLLGDVVDVVVLLVDDVVYVVVVVPEDGRVRVPESTVGAGAQPLSSNDAPTTPTTSASARVNRRTFPSPGSQTTGEPYSLRRARSIARWPRTHDP